MSEEGFLSRWSRRKLEPGQAEAEPAPLPAARAEPSAPPEPGAPAEPPPSAAERARAFLAKLARRQPAAPGPAQAFDLSSLPSLESLTAESDIAAFLQQGVPLALRNAALRRIWTLDPAIRDFVGPLDYGWDYNAPDGVPGFGLDLGGADVKRLLAQALGQAVEDDVPGEAGPSAGAAGPGEAAGAGADARAVSEDSAGPGTGEAIACESPERVQAEAPLPPVALTRAAGETVRDAGVAAGPAGAAPGDASPGRPGEGASGLLPGPTAFIPADSEGEGTPDALPVASPTEAMPVAAPSRRRHGGALPA